MKLIKFSELLKAQLVTFLRNSQGLLTIEFVIKVKIGGRGSRVVFLFLSMLNSGIQGARNFQQNRNILIWY